MTSCFLVLAVFGALVAVSSAENSGSCSRMYWTETALDGGDGNAPGKIFGAAVGFAEEQEGGGSSDSVLNVVTTNAAGTGFEAATLDLATDTWTDIAKSNPEGANPSMAAGAAIAAVGGKFVTFGGESDNKYSDHIHVFEAGAWSNGETTGTAKPDKRAWASATGLATGADVVVIGGSDDTRDYDDAWLLKMRTATTGAVSFSWHLLEAPATMANAMPPRKGHAATAWPKAATDANPEERVLVFGGCQVNGEAVQCLNDVWMLTVPDATAVSASPATVALVQVAASGDAAPSPREHASALIHDGKLYVYGGCSWSGAEWNCDNYVAVLDLTASNPKWAAPQYGNSERGAAVTGAATLFVAAQNGVVVLGGCASAAAETGTCLTKRQKINVAGACSDTCKNGATISPNGACQCTPEFKGPTCETRVSSVATDCPENCNGHGTCTGGKCECENSWGGAGCTDRVCPEKCNGHGTCTTEKASGKAVCVCSSGFHGEACSKLFCSPRDCSGHGSCNTELGMCDCRVGFSGAGCQLETGCTNNCTGHGACVAQPAQSKTRPSVSRCECVSGWTGDACDSDTRCPSGGCGSHGVCSNYSCICDEGFEGDQCGKKSCPSNCNGHGQCDPESGTCVCSLGFLGDDCGKALRCLNNCSGPAQGVCVQDVGQTSTVPEFDGVCKCKDGFRGDDCSLKQCPAAFPHQFASDKEECAGATRGVCDTATGKCNCKPAFGGFACESACPAGKQFKSGVFHPDENPMGIALPHPDGERAQMDAAMGACSGHGVCVTTADGQAKCQCEPGIGGPACDREDECAQKDCAGHGACFRGQCVCMAGYHGDGCASEHICPGTSEDTGACSGHGECRLGKCFCNAGWNGEDCATKSLCPKGCSGHGRCHDEKCYCAVGWVGDGCETHESCPKKCSGHGTCFLDECRCEPGFTGPACDELDGTLVPVECEGGCSGRGECRMGKCFCEAGYEGPNCASLAAYECPTADGKQCAGHGICKYNKCFCMPGFSGLACTDDAKCPGDCSGNGVCANGMCYCKPPYRGVDCNSTLACPQNCNDRGICLNGKCMCTEGFGGKACSIGTDQCPNQCSGHGSCAIGKCICDPGYDGKDCAKHVNKRCPNDCSQSGFCHNGKCFCEPGLVGDDCSSPIPCPEGCKKNGICSRGICYCMPGFRGANCSTPEDAEAKADETMAVARRSHKVRACPNQCSKHGFCFDGKCLCQPGYEGVDCSVVTIGDDMCQNDCGAFGGTRPARGRCWLGKCFCYPGFKGSDCTIPVQLPCSSTDNGPCDGHGICHYGKCFCDLGFTGQACSTEVHVCDNDCSGHGQCHRGRCKCEIGFTGPICNTTVGGAAKCPDNCNGRGACILGQCMCRPGYTGRACQTSNAEGATVKEAAHPRDSDFTTHTVSDPAKDFTVEIAKPPADYYPPSNNPKADKVSAKFVDGSLDHPDGTPSQPRALGRTSSHKTQALLMLLEESSSLTRGLHRAPSCSGHGIAHQGQCFCEPGFEGEACESEQPCPHGCGNHGECSRGVCVCHPGFSGPSCAVEAVCPQGCSSRGVCKWGKCFCDIGYRGDACEIESGNSDCPAQCNQNGICEDHVCFCKAEFTGEDCGTPVNLQEASSHAAAASIMQHANSSPSMFLVVAMAMIAFFVGIVSAGGYFLWKRSSGAAASQHSQRNDFYGYSHMSSLEVVE